jgi:hypothetical protein
MFMHKSQNKADNLIEPTRKPRLTKIEVHAQSISRADSIIDSIMTHDDVLVRLALWEKLRETVGSAAYIAIRMKSFVKYGNTE